MPQAEDNVTGRSWRCNSSWAGNIGEWPGEVGWRHPKVKAPIQFNPMVLLDAVTKTELGAAGGALAIRCMGRFARNPRDASVGAQVSEHIEKAADAVAARMRGWCAGPWKECSGLGAA